MTIDVPLFIETQIQHRIVHLTSQAAFRTPSGVWTAPREALIDTGSSVSVIPHSVWQNIAYRSLAEGTEMKIGGLTVSGQLALVTLRLQDEQTVSPPLRVKANLIQEEGIPLILGFEDVLTELLLVSDYRNNRAYVLFNH
jgi:predicted aspartyl protease